MSSAQAQNYPRQPPAWLAGQAMVIIARGQALGAAAAARGGAGAHLQRGAGPGGGYNAGTVGLESSQARGDEGCGLEMSSRGLGRDYAAPCGGTLGAARSR